MSQLLVGAVIAESDFAVLDVSAACDGFVVFRVRSTLEWKQPAEMEQPKSRQRKEFASYVISG